MAQNPIEKLTEWSQKKPNSVYLRQPINGQWKEYTFLNVFERAKNMAAALNAAGMAQQNVAILSKNCAHWLISDFAIWMSGGVSVPLLSTYSNENLEKIFELSGVKTIFCGKLDNWETLRKVIPDNVECISYPDFPLEGCTPWEEYVAKHAQPDFKVVAREEDELATITYTSGSTGTPKGVMQSFGAIGFTGEHIRKVLFYTTEDKILSYLPIAHVAERALYEMGCLYGGTQMNFVEDLSTFAATCEEIQPDIFMAVPRIWQKLQEGILKNLPQKKLDLLLSIPIVKTLIQKKIQKKIGVSRARFILTGAAAMPRSLTHWFKKLGIEIREAYGMSETFAYSHAGLQKKIKIGSAGRALPGVTEKISDEGELQIKSPSNMTGFYNAPELTKEAFTEDGFLKTGDLAKVDEDGYVFITGRLKELFKTSKGKYVVPNQIESKLSRLELIDQSCVVGDNMDAPCALLSLMEGWKQKENQNICEELQNFLNEVNQELESHEKIAKFIVTEEAWTIEQNFLTPTMKIKRNVIEEFFKNDVMQSVSTSEKVVFLSRKN